MNGSKKIKIEGISVDTDIDSVVLSLKDAVQPGDVVTFDYKTKSKDQTRGVFQDLAGNKHIYSGLLMFLTKQRTNNY